MEEDWLDRFHEWPFTENWQAGSYLGVKNAVFQFTEILEFAARLTFTQAGGESMHLEIDLRGLQGRRLKLEKRHPGPSYLRSKIADVDNLRYRVDLSTIELITDTKELALKPAVE